MTFEPQVNAPIQFRGSAYRMAEHPGAPGFPYGQEGRQGIVYKLNPEAPGERPLAMKVFRPKYRMPAMAKQAKMLSIYKDITGLSVSKRAVITVEDDGDLVNQHEDLLYSAMMPWIDGPTWADVMLEKQKLTKSESFELAKSLAGILSKMEQEEVAHCDLSAPNVMLPGLVDLSVPSKVELVDLEQMFSKKMDAPDALPLGSPGYAVHKAVRSGLWSPKADRFSGAILITEMLAWSDPDIRNQAYGDSFFDPQELQIASSRYELLIASLTKNWGDDIAQLFIQAWRSEDLAQCPTFGQWILKLTNVKPNTLGWNFKESKEKHNVEESSATPQGQAELLKEAAELERLKDYQGALRLYKTVYHRLLPDNPLHTELGMIIQQLEEQLQVPPAPVPVEPPVETKAVSPPPQPVAPPEPVVKHPVRENVEPAKKKKGKKFSRFVAMLVVLFLLGASGYAAYQFKEDLPYVGKFFEKNSTEEAVTEAGADETIAAVGTDANEQEAATGKQEDEKETISLWTEPSIGSSGDWSSSGDEQIVSLTQGNNFEYISYDLNKYEIKKASLTGNLIPVEGIPFHLEVLVDSETVYKSEEIVPSSQGGGGSSTDIPLDIPILEGNVLAFKVINKSVDGDDSQKSSFSLQNLSLNIYSHEKPKEPLQLESLWTHDMYAHLGSWDTSRDNHTIYLEQGEKNSYVTYNLADYKLKNALLNGVIIPSSGIPFKLEFYVDDRLVYTTDEITPGSSAAVPFNVNVHGKLLTIKVVNNSITGDDNQKSYFALKDVLLNIYETDDKPDSQKESLWTREFSAYEGNWDMSRDYRTVYMDYGENAEYFSYDISDLSLNNASVQGVIIPSSGIPFSLQFKVDGKVVYTTKELSPGTDIPFGFEFPVNGKLLTVTMINKSVEGDDNKKSYFSIKEFLVNTN
ncbi:hypothetical protein J2S09_001294 [Bacillus fengqiuensis]|nr:hypothetical protein [Bacillus fengqiuensis]